MKRSERHHLKENELSALARRTRGFVEERPRHFAAYVVAAIVVALALIGYATWRGRVQGRAHTLLAEALIVEEARVGPPPAPGSPSTGVSFATEREKDEAALAKFKALADQYPATDAGIVARYREAALHTALGNPGEAVQSYQQVIDRAGNSLYGQMARLGLADAQARAGQYESAINVYKELAQQKDGPLPIDGILMQLGRTYLEAGKPADAQQTFNRVVEEFPSSPFIGDARRQLDQVKKS